LATRKLEWRQQRRCRQRLYESSSHGQGYGVPGVGGVPGMMVGGPGMPSGPGGPGITVGGVPGVPGVQQVPCAVGVAGVGGRGATGCCSDCCTAFATSFCCSEIECCRVISTGVPTSRKKLWVPVRTKNEAII